ncbi:hypothetical protein GEMRC1_002443 [Eukaryota sp. GEM-RC1]
MSQPIKVPHQQGQLDAQLSVGGNHYIAFTPGGSRIVYSTSEIMQLKDSPLSHSLDPILEVPTKPKEPVAPNQPVQEIVEDHGDSDSDQFDM